MMCEVLSEFPQPVLPLRCNVYIDLTSLWLNHHVIDAAVIWPPPLRICRRDNRDCIATGIGLWPNDVEHHWWWPVPNYTSRWQWYMCVNNLTRVGVWSVKRANCWSRVGCIHYATTLQLLGLHCRPENVAECLIWLQLLWPIMTDFFGRSGLKIS